MDATYLTAPATASDGTLNVASTTGFLATGVLVIQNEKVTYTGKNALQFTGVTRGVEGTTAAPHSTSISVYNENAGIINYALGFNPTALATANGYTALVMIPIDFFVITMPKLMLWDFNLFQTGDLAVIRVILIAVSMCFYVVFAIQAGQMVAYALRR